MSHVASDRVLLKEKGARIMRELFGEEGRDHRFHIDTAVRVTLERHGDIVRRLRHKADWSYVRDLLFEVLKDRDGIFLAARLANGSAAEQLSFASLLPPGALDAIPPGIVVESGTNSVEHVEARYARKRDYRSYRKILGEQIKADRKTFEAVEALLSAVEHIDDEETPVFDLLRLVST